MAAGRRFVDTPRGRFYGARPVEMTFQNRLSEGYFIRSGRDTMKILVPVKRVVDYNVRSA